MIWRRISFWSAIVRAAEARTSTRVSSISRMIIRIIFAGSSALSSRSVTLAAMISRVREKMPMRITPIHNQGPVCPISIQSVPTFRKRPETRRKPQIFRLSATLNILPRWWEMPPTVGHNGAQQPSSSAKPAFLDAVERASRAAPLDRPVLVIGERGTGKELIAERLHHLSPRWDGPLIMMNCAALPETLIEAELFGHEAGAFTGATKARAGRFEEANGGTLFLDELATCRCPAQDRLLRAVEYGEVTRIGAPADPGRRPHRRRDQRASAPAGRAGPLPRRSARPAELRGRHPAAAARPRRATSRCSPIIRPPHGAGDRMATGRASAAARWRSSKPMTGPATSASCATSSSARSIAGRTGAADRGHPVRPVRIALGEGRRLPGGPRSRPAVIETAGGAAGGRNARGRRCAGRLPLRRSPTMSERCSRTRWPNRFNQRATAAALGLSYDQLRHALETPQAAGVCCIDGSIRLSNRSVKTSLERRIWPPQAVRRLR